MMNELTIATFELREISSERPLVGSWCVEQRFSKEEAPLRVRRRNNTADNVICWQDPSVNGSQPANTLKETKGLLKVLGPLCETGGDKGNLPNLGHVNDFEEAVDVLWPDLLEFGSSVS